MADTKFFQWSYPEETEDPYYEKIASFFSQIDDQAFAMMNTAGNIVIPPANIQWEPATNTLTWDTFFEVPLMGIGFSVKAEFAPDGTSKSLVVPDGYRVTILVPNTASANATILLGIVSGAVSIEHGLMTLGYARGDKFYMNLSKDLNSQSFASSGTSLIYDGGNVGIGKLPTAKLQVYDATTSDTIVLSGLQSSVSGMISGIIFRNEHSTSTGSTATIKASTDSSVANGSLIFSTASASNTPEERIRIDSFGNVGVGTNNPQSRLHVSNTNSFDAVRITQTGIGNALLVEDSANDTTPFVIKHDGKVGIGTSTPGSTLDVSGSVSISGTLSMSSQRITSIADPTSAQDASSKSYVDTGLSTKQATITGAASSVTTSNLTPLRTIVSDSTGKIAAFTVTSAELGHLSSVSGSIQGQINSLQSQLLSQESEFDAFAATKGQVSGLASLGPDGKILAAQVPQIALVNVSVVANIAARDALVSDEGDVAKVLDVGDGKTKTYVYDGSGWIEISASQDVTMVNGKIGVVTLTTADISESGTSNRWFTQEREDALLSFSATAGENLLAGDAVYVSSGSGSDSARTSGRLYKLDPSNDDRFELAGIVSQSVSSGSSASVKLNGIMTISGGSFQVGKKVFVSSTPGLLTSLVPSGSGWIVPVGVAMTSTKILLKQFVSYRQE